MLCVSLCYLWVIRLCVRHYAGCHYAGCHYAGCHYDVCHYVGCHYAEGRGATKIHDETNIIFAKTRHFSNFTDLTLINTGEKETNKFAIGATTFGVNDTWPTVSYSIIVLYGGVLLGTVL